MGRMGGHLLSLVFLQGVFLGVVRSSHFRGVTLSWKATDDPSKIDIDWRFSFRRSGASESCDEADIANGTLIDLGGKYIECEQCSFPQIARLKYQCTDFSLAEDWQTGVGGTRFTIEPGVNVFDIRYSDCCWISLGNAASSYSAQAHVDLTPYNGEINSSPVTSWVPVSRVQQGCEATLNIPAADPDGDEVKCRWPSTIAEGASVYPMPNSMLDESNCVLTVNASSLSGWYGVALILEDFSPSTSAAKSKVPLQFLINVYSSYDSCTDRPDLIAPSPAQGHCYGLAPETLFSIQIRAKAASAPIREIETSSPVGMVTSATSLVPGRTDEYYITATWTPATSQMGSHVMCFNALDSDGRSSEVRCVHLSVGAPPTVIQSWPAPDSLVYINLGVWTFKFDQNVNLQTSSTTVFITTRYGMSMYPSRSVTQIAADTIEVSLQVSLNPVIDECTVSLSEGVVTGLGPCPIPSIRQSVRVYTTTVLPVATTGGPYQMATTVIGDPGTTAQIETTGFPQTTSVPEHTQSPPQMQTTAHQATTPERTAPYFETQTTSVPEHTQSPPQMQTTAHQATTPERTAPYFETQTTSVPERTQSPPQMQTTAHQATTPERTAPYFETQTTSVPEHTQSPQQMQTTAHQATIPERTAPYFETQTTSVPEHTQSPPQMQTTAHQATTPEHTAPNFETYAPQTANPPQVWTTLHQVPNPPLHTQSAQQPSMECSDSAMTVFIPRSLIGDTMASHLHFLDPACVGSPHNGTHVKIVTTYDRCGTFMEVQGENVIFFNVIHDEAVPITPGSVITRDRDIEIPVQCTMDLEGMGEMSFRPDTSKITFREDGYGSFNFSLRLYRDINYMTPYLPSDYPVHAKFGDKLYFEARTWSEPGLELFVQTCRATPTSNPDDFHRYTFIKDGCMEDNSLQFHPSYDPDVERFEIDVFAFIDTLPQPVVYVHCDMILCNLSDAHSKCAMGCATGNINSLLSLHRRSARSASGSHAYAITQGPISLEKREAEGAPGGMSSGQVPVLLTAVCLLVGCVLVLAGVVAVMRRRNRLLYQYGPVAVDDEE